MKCPHCKHKLIQKSGSTMRLRTKGPILLKSEGAETKCYWCSQPVTLPLELKAGVEVPEERFILRKDPPAKT